MPSPNSIEASYYSMGGESSFVVAEEISSFCFLPWEFHPIAGGRPFGHLVDRLLGRRQARQSRVRRYGEDQGELLHGASTVG
jgi:hypothetical protein